MGQDHLVVTTIQGDVVRTVAIVLSRTPEDRADARLAVPPINGWERSEPNRILVDDATIGNPASLGLENLTRIAFTAHLREQDVPFGVRRQVPSRGTNALNQGR